MGILETNNSDESAEVKDELRTRGFGSYPYCLVMACADKNLADIITSENIAGKKPQDMRAIATQISAALSHMHSRGFVHLDVKPKNIMRAELLIKMIDLDASQQIGNSFAGAKFSSAYVSIATSSLMLIPF